MQPQTSPINCCPGSTSTSGRLLTCKSPNQYLLEHIGHDCSYSAGADSDPLFKLTDHMAENHIPNWPVFYFSLLRPCCLQGTSLLLMCLKEKSLSLQFPAVIYNLLSLQPILPCNLSSVSAFSSAKNSYNGYIKSSKFWFPFSLVCLFFF